MYTLVAKDWKELSKAASQERDPKKFMELIEQLNEALEQEHGIAESPAADRDEQVDLKQQFDAA